MIDKHFTMCRFSAPNFKYKIMCIKFNGIIFRFQIQIFNQLLMFNKIFRKEIQFSNLISIFKLPSCASVKSEFIVNHSGTVFPPPLLFVNGGPLNDYFADNHVLWNPISCLNIFMEYLSVNHVLSLKFHANLMMEKILTQCVYAQCTQFQIQKLCVLNFHGIFRFQINYWEISIMKNLCYSSTFTICEWWSFNMIIF